MSQKKIKKPVNSKKVITPKPRPGSVPPQPQLTKEQTEYVQSCQSITQKLSQILAKVAFGPAASWERGAEEIDRLTIEIGDDCMKKFRGILKLDGLIVFFGYIVGHRAGIGCVKTKKPLADVRFTEAGKLFEAAVRLGYVSMVTVMQQKVQVAKTVPKKR